MQSKTVSPSSIKSSIKSPGELRQAALEHIFIGMNNHAMLGEEGGPLVVDRGEGIYIWDVDGNRYMDGISGMYFRNTGHGREEIAKAIYEQLSNLSANVYASVTPAAIELATEIASLTPGDLTRTFFCQGGSEANESALKLAQAYQMRMGEKGRYKVISRRGSYHGSTYGTMWLGEHPGFPRTDYQPKPSSAVHVPAPHFYRCEFNSDSPEQCGELAALAIEKAIISEGPHSVAAVIGEPVTQPLGGVVPPENYWPMVREICDRYGVVLIFDEVITGFGRLGEWFGADVVNTQPDIISFAKGVTSGYFPLGGCIADRRIADAFAGGPEKTWSHMFTYSAHPGGVAAGLKNLEIMKRENLVQNARERGAQLADRLAEMMERHEIIGDARGMGLIQGLELVADRETKRSFPPEVGIGGRFTDALKRRGIWIRVGSYILPLSPPLSITAGEIDELCDAVEDAIVEVSAGLGRGVSGTH